MRSIEEIDAEIAKLRDIKAQLDMGIPTRMTPEYRAGRFDYIVEGNRSGLDAYQQAVNAAVNNKLQRDFQNQQRIANEAFQASENEKNRQVQLKSAADSKEDDELKWHRDLAIAKSTLRQVRNEYKIGKASQKDVDDAVAEYNYLVDHGTAKGYKYVPGAESAEAGGDNPAVKMQQSLAQMIATDNPTKDQLDRAEMIAAFLEDNGADMSDVKANIANKRDTLANKDWELAMDSAKALIGKPKVTIKELEAKKAELQGYSGKKGYDSLINDIDKKIAALRPKTTIPFTRGNK